MRTPLTRFKHPFLFGGTIQIGTQRYIVRRGVVELPDDVGAAAGFERVSDDDEGDAC